MPTNTTSSKYQAVIQKSPATVNFFINQTACRNKCMWQPAGNNNVHRKDLTKTETEQQKMYKLENR